MEIKLEIPMFVDTKGIQYNWENGFEIEVIVKNGVVNILANKEGLVSLANHLLNLAQTDVPSGYHLHFDEYNSLEAGSNEMIIQKE